MKKTLRGGALAVVLALGLASPARADWAGVVSECGGAAFQTCLSGQLFASGNTLTMVITNNDPYGSVFMGIGLINLPAGTTLSLTSVEVDGNPVTANWSTPANDLNTDWGTAPGTLVLGINPVDQPTQNGLQVGQTATIVFSLSNAEDLVDDIGIAVHAISGPNKCSTKFGVYADGSTVDAGDDYDGTCVSVPEPLSGGLVLVGLTGLAFVARRRGFEIVDGD